MALASHDRLNALIDAAQSPDPDLTSWTREIVDTARPFLDHGCGFGVHVVRRGDAGHEVEIFHGRGVLKDATMAQLYERFVNEQTDDSLFEGVWQIRKPIVRFSAVVQNPSQVVREIFKGAGAADAFALTASGGTGRYGSLFGYLPAGAGISPKLRAMLAQARPHIEAGLRLRCDPFVAPIAVLTDSGKLLHLAADSELRAYTPELKAHVARLEAIRAGREEIDLGQDAWDNLCAGRWLLTQCSESDGRRSYVVFEDRAETLDWYQISGTDRKIVSYSMSGLNGKEVAAKMKISQAQVSTRLAATSRALGLRSRSELMRLVAILRPHDRRSVQHQKLTHAEQEILAQLELGRRNEEIAAQRGRSVKTVANQVAAILRKTATTSRRAAVAAR